MKYTRYDFKRRKSENTLIVVVLVSILLAAFFIGTLLSNIIMKNNVTQNVQPAANSNIENINVNKNKICKFIVIQAGKFIKIENLEQAEKNLVGYGTTFTIEEQNGTRLLLGIFNEDESLKLIKELNTKKIENSKITFEIQTDNLCNEEIAAIVYAELEVVNKLSNKDIKSIQTDELKNWTKGLEKVDLKSGNILVLDDYKSHINALPKELTVNNAAEIEVYIYNLLKKTANK